MEAPVTVPSVLSKAGPLHARRPGEASLSRFYCGGAGDPTKRPGMPWVSFGFTNCWIV